MESKQFSLGNSDDNRLIKIFRIVFGVVCIGISVFWLVYNLQSDKSDKFDTTLWITILFLSLFGFYQIWAGLGFATRFVSINAGSLRLKRNSLLPEVRILSEEIEKIKFFTLNVIFCLKSKKKIQLRFGTINFETNELIVDELISFAENNQIPFEVIEEEI